MTAEKRRRTVYAHQPYDIKSKVHKRVPISKLYIGWTPFLGRRIRNHLKETPGTPGARKTHKMIMKYGSIAPYFFVTGFTKDTYARSFETALQHHRIPKGERSKIPTSVRRLIRVVNKTTWSEARHIPPSVTLPPLKIHWLRKEFKPQAGDYVMNFPAHVKHVYKSSYAQLESILSNKTLSTLDKKQQLQDCLQLNK